MVMKCRKCDWYLCSTCSPLKYKCPSNHELQEYLSKGGSCDGCGNRVMEGTVVKDCRQCNWYLCSTCSPDTFDVKWEDTQRDSWKEKDEVEVYQDSEKEDSEEKWWFAGIIKNIKTNDEGEELLEVSYTLYNGEKRTKDYARENHKDIREKLERGFPQNRLRHKVSMEVEMSYRHPQTRIWIPEKMKIKIDIVKGVQAIVGSSRSNIKIRKVNRFTLTSQKAKTAQEKYNAGLSKEIQDCDETKELYTYFLRSHKKKYQLDSRAKRERQWVIHQQADIYTKFYRPADNYQHESSQPQPTVTIREEAKGSSKQRLRGTSDSEQ